MKRVISTSKKRDRNAQARNGRGLRMLMKLPHKIELVPLSTKDGGGYLATIPILKGCQSDGSTPDEAIKNLREAQKAWLASALKHDDAIPVPQ